MQACLLWEGEEAPFLGVPEDTGCSGPHQVARGADGSLIWGEATHRQCETPSGLTWGFRVKPPTSASLFPSPLWASSAKKSWSLTGKGPRSPPCHTTQETGGTPLPASPAPGGGRGPSVLQQMGSQVGLSVGHHLSACLYVLPSFLLVLLPPGPCSLASLAPQGQPGLELQREFKVIRGHTGELTSSRVPGSAIC